MAADTYDILTLTEGKTALNGLTGWDADDDTELEQVITAASRLVDSVYGYVVTRSGLTRTVFAPVGPIFLDVPAASQTFTITITTVTEYTQGTATVLTAEDADTAGTYRFNARTGQLLRRSSFQTARWGTQEVVIAYTAGRYADTASVDRKFKEAAAVALMHLWQHRGAQSGAALAGGEGGIFGGVPFSTDTLRQKLVAMYPDEVLTPGIG